MTDQPLRDPGRRVRSRRADFRAQMLHDLRTLAGGLHTMVGWWDCGSKVYDFDSPAPRYWPDQTTLALHPTATSQIWRWRELGEYPEHSETSCVRTAEWLESLAKGATAVAIALRARADDIRHERETAEQAARAALTTDLRAT